MLTLDRRLANGMAAAIAIIASVTIGIATGCSKASDRIEEPESQVEDQVDGSSRPSLDEPFQELVLLSDVYTVDRIYRSMQGPMSDQQILLGSPDGPPELIWVTGYEAIVVDESGAQQLDQEFMCHSNLNIDKSAHRAAIEVSPGFGPRVFTIGQGQSVAHFPEGFGIPILSTEELLLRTQVLNLNHQSGAGTMRHQTTIEFVRDADTDGEMTALFPSSAYGLALLEGDTGHYGEPRPKDEDHGPGCLIKDNAALQELSDQNGRSFTGHWIVNPGREVNRTLVTHLLRLPYDTKVHYIVVHLHPFAESIELRDLTSGDTVFKSRARNYTDKIGLQHLDEFSSTEGVMLYKDHDYEIISVYDNTTDSDQDSMAVMYLYLRDLQFDRERLRARLGKDRP